MSDNLGPNQTRVLDPDERSFETVVYQKKKPPLSCEHNFTETLSSEMARGAVQAQMPSGWDIVGTVKDDDGTAMPGDVICSSSYAANTFKLIGTNTGLGRDLSAWVNGYRVTVKGIGATTGDDNIITLPEPPTITTRVDFVFLEVWRVLLGTSDTVWRNGNRDWGGANPANDLVDPAIGVETSRRIQVQYRLRVETAQMDDYPDGFTPDMYAQGPLSAPLSCTLARFSPVQGDPGLWRSGNGDEASQATLGTVDGYTYAIPMFAVTRRNTGAYDVDNEANGASKTLANYLAGTASDRPDGKYNDFIVADDILDMRHLVASGLSPQEMADRAFPLLASGKLRTKMAKDTVGGEHYGIVLVRANSTYDRPGAEHIPGYITSLNSGLRRVFSNAQHDQVNTLKMFTVNDKSPVSPTWAAGNTVTVDLTTLSPVSATVRELTDTWRTDTATGTAAQVLPNLTNYTVSGLNTSIMTVTIAAGNPIVGTSNRLTLDFTVRFAAGPYGLTRTADEMLESRFSIFPTDSTVSLAMTETGFQVRGSAAVSTTDGTRYDWVKNMGANTTEVWDFGHQLVHHVAGTGTSIVTLPMTLYGYSLIGVAWVNVSGMSRTFDLERNSGSYPGQIAINVGSPAIPSGADVEIGLYTATKFFQANRQGRAITDTFEMRMMSDASGVRNGSNLVFTLDATSAEILKIGGNVNAGGFGTAFVNGVQRTLTTSNMDLPTDTTNCRATISFPPAFPPPTSALIEVPVLLKGGMLSGEGATWFYREVPYQGLLDGTAQGTVLADGPAVTTTAGSGGIVNYTYSEGVANFADSTVVTSGMAEPTYWTATARAGYTISSVLDSSKNFKIAQVVDDHTLYLTTKTGMDTTSTAYVITGWDVPADMPANVVDRLPTLDSDTDAKCMSDDISTAVTDAAPTLATRKISAQQDVAGEVTAGVNPADRGRSEVLVDGTYGVGSAGVRFEKLDASGAWQRTYASYAFNEAGTGQVRLMVVASESDGESKSRFFDQNSGLDTVDLFEMPGRPLILRKPA